MAKYSQCGRVFNDGEDDTCVASISGSIMGDGYTESYFFCHQCEADTVEIYLDRFFGEDNVSVRAPVPTFDGDAKVELIKRCFEPWN